MESEILFFLDIFRMLFDDSLTLKHTAENFIRNSKSEICFELYEKHCVKCLNEIDEFPITSAQYTCHHLAMALAIFSGSILSDYGQFIRFFQVIDHKKNKNEKQIYFRKIHKPTIFRQIERSVQNKKKTKMFG